MFDTRDGVPDVDRVVADHGQLDALRQLSLQPFDCGDNTVRNLDGVSARHFQNVDAHRPLTIDQRDAPRFLGGIHNCRDVGQTNTVTHDDLGELLRLPDPAEHADELLAVVLLDPSCRDLQVL